MTTAHRPTFEPAKGGTGRNEGDLSKLSQQYSSKDMPSHTKLKYRQKGQASAEEIQSKNFRPELEEKEQVLSKERRSVRDIAGAAIKKPHLESSTSHLDADDPLDDIAEEDESDEEDDTAELMSELARIKKERAAEKAIKATEEAEEQERIRMENIMCGNPLLSDSKSTDFKVKRRWNDDVVFKNCAKSIDERKKEPLFINDAIRSEFHKKFMEKYVK